MNTDLSSRKLRRLKFEFPGLSTMEKGKYFRNLCWVPLGLWLNIKMCMHTVKLYNDVTNNPTRERKTIGKFKQEQFPEFKQGQENF